MCVLALKYMPEYGFVCAKNRDRSYKPEINIRQSFRRGVERLYIDDSKTHWTEGINEFGVGIINTTLLVKKDEKEGTKAAEVSDRTFYSPGGKAIRTALFEKTPKDALKKLIELEMEGFSCVFSENEAYILESPMTSSDGTYDYKFIKCDKDKYYVRTNHGIIFPNAGYPQYSDDPYMQKSRKSSESRYQIVHELLKTKNSVKNPRDLLKILSAQPNDDYSMNPLRKSDTHGKHIMVTTGQVLIVPKTKTLHYRPIWCSLKFNFDKINSHKSKTFFEAVSSNDLISEQKIKSFKKFWEEFQK